MEYQRISWKKWVKYNNYPYPSSVLSKFYDYTVHYELDRVLEEEYPIFRHTHYPDVTVDTANHRAMPPLNPFTCYTPCNLSILNDIQGFLKALPMRPEFEEPLAFITDAIYPLNTDDDLIEKALWLQSPICKLLPHEDFLKSLTSTRRYQARKHLKYPFQASVKEKVGLNELDQMFYQLERRWGEENAPFAQFQLLFTVACQEAYSTWYIEHNSCRAWFVCFTPETATFQGITFTGNENDPDGQWMLLQAVKLIHEKGLSYIDPTCHTIIDEDSSDVYKRSIINQDRLCPILYLSPIEVEEYIKPPYFAVDRWHTTGKQEIVFKGVK